MALASLRPALAPRATPPPPALGEPGEGVFGLAAGADLEVEAGTGEAGCADGADDGARRDALAGLAPPSPRGARRACGGVRAPGSPAGRSRGSGRRTRPRRRGRRARACPRRPRCRCRSARCRCRSAGVCVCRTVPRTRPSTGQGSSPLKAPMGTATSLPPAPCSICDTPRSASSSSWRTSALDSLLATRSVRSFVLRTRSASRLRRARSREARTRQRLRGALLEVGPRPVQLAHVGAEARQALVVAAGQRVHEPVAVEEVGGPVHGEQEPQVAQLARACRARAPARPGPAAPRGATPPAPRSRFTVASSCWFVRCRFTCASRSSSPRSRTSISRRSTWPSSDRAWPRVASSARLQLAPALLDLAQARVGGRRAGRGRRRRRRGAGGARRHRRRGGGDEQGERRGPPHHRGLPSRSGGQGNAEDGEHGGRDVHDAGRGRAELAVDEEHAAADLGRGRAVVAAPLARVVLHDGARDAAHGVLPADAVAVVEAGLQVRRVPQVRPVVDVVAAVDRAHHRAARLPGPGSASSRAAISSCSALYSAPSATMPLRLAPAQVEVDLAEPHRVGPRAASSPRRPRSARARTAPRGSACGRRSRPWKTM